jgi:hypothetical protein
MAVVHASFLSSKVVRISPNRMQSPSDDTASDRVAVAKGGAKMGLARPLPTALSRNLLDCQESNNPDIAVEIGQKSL